MLKNSLNQTNQRVRKLQVDMDFNKVKQQPSPASVFPLSHMPLPLQSPIAVPTLSEQHQHQVMGSGGRSVLSSLTPECGAMPGGALPTLFTTPLPATATMDTLNIGETFPVISGFSDDISFPDEQIEMGGGARKDNPEVFYQSFEKSNELIQGIFQERDALEKQLQLSRQQRRKGNVRNS